MTTTDQGFSPGFLRKIRTLTRFTTGQVARICAVAPRTVSKWIDDPDHRYFFEHEIYRLPPTTAEGKPHDRRVTRAGLIRFLKAREMFTRLALLQSLSRIMYAGRDRGPCQRILGDNFDVVPAHCDFDLARLIKRDTPALVIVDFGNPGNFDPRAICGEIRTHFTPASVGGPRILGFLVGDGVDQDCVDEFVLNVENLPHRVQSIMPNAASDRRAAS